MPKNDEIAMEDPEKMTVAPLIQALSWSEENKDAIEEDSDDGDNKDTGEEDSDEVEAHDDVLEESQEEKAATESNDDATEATTEPSTTDSTTQWPPQEYSDTVDAMKNVFWTMFKEEYTRLRLSDGREGGEKEALQDGQQTTAAARSVQATTRSAGLDVYPPDGAGAAITTRPAVIVATAVLLRIWSAYSDLKANS